MYTDKNALFNNWWPCWWPLNFSHLSQFCINPDQIGFINLQSFSFTFYALCVLHKVSEFLMFLSMAEAFSAPRTSLDSDSFCINASWTLAQQPITQYMLLTTFPFCFSLSSKKFSCARNIKSFKSLKRKF